MVSDEKTASVLVCLMYICVTVPSFFPTISETIF